MDVLCVGNATLDVFVRLKNETDGFIFDKFSNQIGFKLGEKIKVGQYVFSLGGNACNVSVGLKRLGANSSLATEIGSDEFSDKILTILKNEGVATDLVKRGSSTIPFFNIILSYESERSILEEEKNNLEGLDLPQENPGLIYLTSLNGQWEKLYENVLNSLGNSLLAFNPGTSQLDDVEKIKPVLSKCTYLFVNVSEAQKIAGQESYDVENLFSTILKMGPKTVVITDAANGSYTNEENDIYQLGPFSGGVSKERTGAGDSFASGFLYAVLNDKKPSEALAYGSINAYHVIQEIGAQKGLLKKGEIEEKREDNKDFVAVKA